MPQLTVDADRGIPTFPAFARSLFLVVEAVDSGRASLRERKRLRTRLQLVGAAIELSRRHGFENATIEQIAAAVDVSPRTFSRYFPTKEAAILSVTLDLAETALLHMTRVDPRVGPLDALVQAHLNMFGDVHAGRQAVTPTMLSGALLVIGESPALRTMAVGNTHVGLLTAVADRMGARPEDRGPWLVMRVWSSVLSCASREVGVSIALGQCDAAMTAKAMGQRVIDVRAELTTLVPPIGP